MNIVRSNIRKDWEDARKTGRVHVAGPPGQKAALGGRRNASGGSRARPGPAQPVHHHQLRAKRPLRPRRPAAGKGPFTLCLLPFPLPSSCQSPLTSGSVATPLACVGKGECCKVPDLLRATQQVSDLAAFTFTFIFAFRPVLRSAL